MGIIKTKARLLMSKNNKMNFLENEIKSLKEESTKLKIQISELIIERDQLKELDNDRQTDFMEWLKDFDKIKSENKVIKKNMMEFQNSVENSKKLEKKNEVLLIKSVNVMLQEKNFEGFQKNENFEDFRKSATSALTQNFKKISEFRDSFNIEDSNIQSFGKDKISKSFRL